MKNINLKIGGKAGEGVKVTGLVLTKILSRYGYSTFAYQEYPSLIRGGHNVFQVHASVEPVSSQVLVVNLLIAFDQNTISLHQKELTDKSLVVYDSDLIKLEDKLVGQYIAIPLKKMAQANGNPLMANTIALGAVMALAGLETEKLKEILKEVFGGKGEEVVQANQKSAQDGYDFIKKNFSNQNLGLEKPGSVSEQMVITGNEALALGAISAGLKFYSAYPMTPSTSILHYLAGKAEETGIVVKQPEDEIAAINQAVGASFAGVRSMTATSGGGFCLMTEGLGLAGMTETPIVIVNSMRPGPASGMPTWSGQGDLRFIVHAAQDDFPRIVLAPGDGQECFDLGRKAFYFAEKYQLPVIILLDKNISESYYSPVLFKGEHKNERYSFTQPQEGYLRYKITDNGISPRCFLGDKNGHHLANSYEHDQFGLVTEDGEGRNKMMEKRNRKMEALKVEVLKQEVFGNQGGEIGLISWGSNKGTVLEALKELPQVKFLHLSWLWPFPKEQVAAFINSVKRTVCLEGNSSGQLAGLIKEHTGRETEKYLKYDGRPFYPEDIREYLKVGKINKE